MSTRKYGRGTYGIKSFVNKLQGSPYFGFAQLLCLHNQVSHFKKFIIPWQIRKRHEDEDEKEDVSRVSKRETSLCGVNTRLHSTHHFHLWLQLQQQQASSFT